MAISATSPRYARKPGNFNCYIKNNLSGDIIPFIFTPDSISDTLSASFSEEAIPGASAPVITYSGTGARKVSITILVPIDYLPSGYQNTEDYINAFRRLVYPNYKGGDNIQPPSCTLHLTNLIMYGACTGVNIDYKVGEGGRYGNDGAIAASVGLSFIETWDFSPSYSSGELFTNPIGLANTELYSEVNTSKHITREKRNVFNWGNFRLKGDSLVTTVFKMYRFNTPYENSQFVPKYNDEGYITGSGDYSVVIFYYVSNIPIEFTGDDIKGEKTDEKSAT